MVQAPNDFQSSTLWCVLWNRVPNANAQVLGKGHALNECCVICHYVLEQYGPNGVLFSYGTGQQRYSPLAQTNKTWVFVSSENTRLDELIALLGNKNEIAGLDTDAFGQ